MEEPAEPGPYSFPFILSFGRDDIEFEFFSFRGYLPGSKIAHVFEHIEVGKQHAVIDVERRPDFTVCCPIGSGGGKAREQFRPDKREDFRVEPFGFIQDGEDIVLAFLLSLLFMMIGGPGYLLCYLLKV